MARPQTATDRQIIDGAVRAIGKHGPVKLTLAHVAAEVGITPTAIVQRFGSKHALLLAIGETSGNEINDAVDTALAKKAPLDALLQVLIGQVRALRSPEEMANHLAFLHLDLADPELRVRARQHGRSLLEGIRRLVQAATEAGELQPGDTEERATAIYTTYNGALISWAMVGKGALSTWLRQQLELCLEPHRSTSTTRS